MADLLSDEERLRSESPTGVHPACMLEWNFMASRINSIVTVLRAHKRLGLKMDMRGIADGMQIERAQTALISGRLAIEGVEVCSQPLYNHAMAFRHSIDKGQRVLQNLVDRDVLLPRWGSHSLTPPPSFIGLRSFDQTDDEEWLKFCGACDMGIDGRQWWDSVGAVTLHQYAVVKSADAARVWFRLCNQGDNPGFDTPQPELARELRYLLAWLNGAALDMGSHATLLDTTIDSLEQRLHTIFERSQRDDRDDVGV